MDNRESENNFKKDQPGVKSIVASLTAKFEVSATGDVRTNDESNIPSVPTSGTITTYHVSKSPSFTKFGNTRTTDEPNSPSIVKSEKYRTIDVTNFSSITKSGNVRTNDVSNSLSNTKSEKYRTIDVSNFPLITKSGNIKTNHGPDSPSITKPGGVKYYDTIDSATIVSKLKEFVNSRRGEDLENKTKYKYDQPNTRAKGVVTTILQRMESQEHQNKVDNVRCETLAKPMRQPQNTDKRHSDCKLLIYAAREGNLDMVKWLLQHDIDPNIRNNKGRNALLSAACSNRLDVFRELLQVSDITQVDDNGWNALHISVVCGHIKIVQEAASVIPIDSRSLSGLSALCLASNIGYLEIVRYLLQAGADPTVSSHQGWSSLHFASRSTRPDHFSILYYLINSDKCGKMLNMRTKDGQTPLLLAVQSGNLDCVKLLLDSGANPNVKDSRGWTAARIAAIHNYKHIAQYLSNYNATL